MRWIACALAVVVSVGSATAQTVGGMPQAGAEIKDKQWRAALSRSIEDYKTCVSVKDDAFEKSAVLNSLNCFTYKRGLLKIAWDDYFVRAYIDKSTGNKSFMIYARLINDEWLFPRSANYGTPLSSVETFSIASDVDCSRYGCTHYEDVGFDISNEEIERVRRAPPEDLAMKLWFFRIKTKAGVDVDNGIPANELRAIIDVVDQYKPVGTN